MLKGSKHSEESKRKNSESHKGKRHTQDTKKKISNARKGVRLSEKTKKRISRAQKGNKYGWKGMAAGNRPKHRWIDKIKGKPSKCEYCKRTDRKKYEWSNIDHKYSRNPEDYIRLCTRCHKRYERENNLGIWKKFKKSD